MKMERLVTLSALKTPPCGRLIMSAWLRETDLNRRPLGYETGQILISCFSLLQFVLFY
jgi:hypothetical protein